MHGEIKAADITINGRVSFAHLGKRVKFSELSPEVQARYKQELPFWPKNTLCQDGHWHQ